MVQVHSEPSAHFLSGESHRAGDHGQWLSAPDARATALRGLTATPLHLCSHITQEEMVPVLCLWIENDPAGSEQSCNYINPNYELKIQKLLMCLFSAARAEVQLLADTSLGSTGCSWAAAGRLFTSMPLAAQLWLLGIRHVRTIPE